MKVLLKMDFVSSKVSHGTVVLRIHPTLRIRAYDGENERRFSN